MARPEGADAELTRSEIQKAALHVFAEHGLNGASLRDVSKRAKVSVGLVHHYYGSKDGLFEACMRSVYDDLGSMLAELTQLVETTRSPAQLIERAVVAAYRFAVKKRLAVRLITRAAVTSGELNPRGKALLLQLMDAVSSGLSSVARRPAVELRLPIQSVVFLIARYAVSEEAELEAVVGARGDPHDAVERHLVKLALTLLGIPRRTKESS